MDVDIHLFAIAFEKQQREREAGCRHQIVIGGGERVQNQAVADEASVDEDIDGIAVVLLHLRARNEAVQNELPRRLVGFGHLEGLAVVGQFDDVVEQLAAEDLEDALAQGGDRRGVRQVDAAVPELEGFIGMREAVVRDERGDMREFGLFGAQEFLARRDVEEEIADGDGGAGGAGDLVAGEDFAARDFDARAGLLVVRARFKKPIEETSAAQFSGTVKRTDEKWSLPRDDSTAIYSYLSGF